MPRVRLRKERRYDSPREVEVEQDGRWCRRLPVPVAPVRRRPGMEAQVGYTRQHDWGFGKHPESVPPERLRVHSP